MTASIAAATAAIIAAAQAAAPGVVVGGVIGGIVGNIIAPGGSGLLGVGGGAVAGKAIDKHDSAASCR